MALSDLAVYSEFAYASMTEVLQQQIELFNSASSGTIILTQAANRGDFDNVAFFQKIAGGLVRRRNAYGTGVIAEKVLTMGEDVSVKVAGGTFSQRMDPGMFRWIQMNPETAGTMVGQQMAVDDLADMLNTALGVTATALRGVAAVGLNISTEAGDAGRMSWDAIARAQALFGDRASRIEAWVMHSAAMHSLYRQNLANGAGLFSFGTVNVSRDPFGRVLIMTDSPELVTLPGNGTPPTPDYAVLGLTRGAVVVERNNDFDANEETKNGNENLIRTYQAEWSFNVGVKGFSWDKVSGGKSPTQAALMQSANWDKNVTDNKDLAGVILTANA